MKIIKNVFFSIIFLTNCNLLFSQNTAKDLFKKAEMYDSIGNIESAAEYYTKALILDSSYKNAYFNRGSILIQEKQFAKAQKDFVCYNQIAPNDPEVLYLISICSYYIDDKQSALKTINKSLSIDSMYFDALKLRGSIYLETKNYKLAIADFEKTTSIRSDDAEIFYLKGQSYDGINEYEVALNSYIKSNDLGYNNDQILNNIGHVYFKLNNFSNAIIYFNKAIDLNPTNGLYYFNKGIALNQMGFTENAKECWKKSKALGYSEIPKEILNVIN